MTIKITTWNVNGLRAVLSKDAFAWVPSWAPDILCFQEIKAREDQVAKPTLRIFESYLAYWHSAERAGYSGVMTLSRKMPESTQLGLGIKKFDLEGRCILTRYKDFILLNLYVPNGKRDHGRLSYKLDFYAYLLDLVDSLHTQGERLILCGDFNTAHREIDLRNPKQNQNSSGFLPEERGWIDRFLAHGLTDVYRDLYPEQEDYTWWTYRSGARRRNIGWRLDYFLISEGLLSRVRDVVIHSEIMGSDHCPVTLVLE